MIDMVKKDGGWVRTQRLMRISTFVAKAMSEGEVTIDKTLAWIQWEMGLTEQRAREYLGLVLIHQGWIDDDGIIKS